MHKYPIWSASSLPVSASGSMLNELIRPALSGGGAMSASSRRVCAPALGRSGLHVVFGRGCLPWRGLLGQEQGGGGEECQDLRRDVQREWQRGRRVAESGQAQAARTPSISATEKNVARVSRIIGDGQDDLRSAALTTLGAATWTSGTGRSPCGARARGLAAMVLSPCADRVSDLHVRS
jgi:hypothetical protein